MIGRNQAGDMRVTSVLMQNRSHSATGLGNSSQKSIASGTSRASLDPNVTWQPMWTKRPLGKSLDIPTPPFGWLFQIFHVFVRDNSKFNLYFGMMEPG